MMTTRFKILIFLAFVIYMLVATIIIGCNIYINPIRQAISTAFIFSVTYVVVRRYFKEKYEESLKDMMTVCFEVFVATCLWGIILGGGVIGNSIFHIFSEDTITKTAYGLTVVFAAVLALVFDAMRELEAWK